MLLIHILIFIRVHAQANDCLTVKCDVLVHVHDVCICSATIDCVSGIRWRMSVTYCSQTPKPALVMCHLISSGSRRAIRLSVLWALENCFALKSKYLRSTVCHKQKGKLRKSSKLLCWCCWLGDRKGGYPVYNKSSQIIPRSLPLVTQPYLV